MSFVRLDLYIVKDSSIPKGGDVVKHLNTGAGLFYTDANNGGPTAEVTIVLSNFTFQH